MVGMTGYKRICREWKTVPKEKEWIYTEPLTDDSPDPPR
jgi:hypothetical protein